MSVWKCFCQYFNYMLSRLYSKFKWWFVSYSHRARAFLYSYLKPVLLFSYLTGLVHSFLALPEIALSYFTPLFLGQEETETTSLLRTHYRVKISYNAIHIHFGMWRISILTVQMSGALRGRVINTNTVVSLQRVYKFTSFVPFSVKQSDWCRVHRKLIVTLWRVHHPAQVVASIRINSCSLTQLIFRRLISTLPVLVRCLLISLLNDASVVRSHVKY